MMKIKKLSALMLATLSLVGLGTSCSSDDTFADSGSGVLRMKMVINSEVTRAEVDQSALADQCVIYISSPKGLIAKYKGIGSFPDEGLSLLSGSYVAEAWTGDSVSASFDKKFYRAYEPFTITQGVQNVVLNCKIANVVASVNPESIDPNLLKDYVITIGNSRASLEFTADNVLTDHGYFMMPDGEDTLTWTITGKDAAGASFTKSGEITGCQRAHEYILNVKYGNPEDPNAIGGAYITIVVDDTELLIEDEITLHAAPKISGVGFDINQPQTRPHGNWSDIYISSVLYGKIGHCYVTFPNKSAFGVDYEQYDLEEAQADVLASLNAAGLTWIDAEADDHSSRRFTFSADMLNRLPDGEYPVQITLVADDGRSTTRTLTLNVSDASVAVDAVDTNLVYSYSATATLSILKDDVTGAALQFRKVGDTDWQTAATTRTSGTVTYNISNLQPSTRYELRAICDGFVNPQTVFFTTESVFAIPNASFENWDTTSSGVIFPGTGSISYWDSGNHGAAKANAVLTTSSTDMVHSGQYSARLESKKATILGIGKFAAGNIFAGTYDKTVGTNGVLTFGRPFDGSRPTALKGWLNYRPGVVTETKGVMIQSGAMDECEIYVALTTATFTVDTSDKTTLFNPSDSRVIAYGHLVTNQNYGDDGQLKEFRIPLEWYAGRENEKPQYLIMVCSASRYGDYFEGGYSVMYLDDFELEYR